MTGFEVLGALAAASALLEQGIKAVGAISSLYSKIRDVPESIGQQCVQIKQLIDIAKLNVYPFCEECPLCRTESPD